jgi:hypothetical protein
MTYGPTWTSLASAVPTGDVAPAVQYVNSASTAFSQWDVSIAFRLQRPVLDSSGATAGVTSDPVVQVVMSPTHAKVLAHLLAGVVTEWEGRFGTLPDVESLLSNPAPQESAPDEARPEEPPSEERDA